MGFRLRKTDQIRHRFRREFALAQRCRGKLRLGIESNAMMPNKDIQNDQFPPDA